MSNAAFVQLAPEWILLVGACLVLVVGAVAKSRSHLATSGLALLLIAAALWATVALGVPDGPAPIPGLWLTSLTYYTRLIALIVGGLIVLVNWHQPVAEERGEYMGLILFSLLGVLLTASANDLITLFFAIELVSVPTYVLIAMSRVDGRASEAAVKYFFLGAMSAAILAYGLSFLYGAAGTTTLYRFDGGSVVSNLSFAGAMGSQALIGLLLVFVGLAFKIAAVPLHVYAADVYEGAASPITGMLGFVPKFAGFVALVKVFAAGDWALPDAVYWMVWVVAAATMTVGNVLALLQHNIKRMLAYSSIAHTGYMLIALLVGPVAGVGPMHDGVAALLFYVAVYGAMNLGAFAVLTAFKVGERPAETLDDLAGLWAKAPAAALGLAICAFSLMGLPPTAGFVGKLYIFSSAFSLDATHAFQKPLIALAVIGVLNSAVGAAYYLRIVATAYVGTPEEEPQTAGGAATRWGLALCALPMLLFFVWPGALSRPAGRATMVLQQTIESPQTHRTAGRAVSNAPRAPRVVADSAAPAPVRSVPRP